MKRIQHRLGPFLEYLLIIFLTIGLVQAFQPLCVRKHPTQNIQHNDGSRQSSLTSIFKTNRDTNFKVATLASSTPSEVTGMLFVDSNRFDRWRFLQELLEGDADVNVVNHLLFQVLEGAVKYPRPDSSGDLTPLPSKMQDAINALLSVVAIDGKIVAMQENYEEQSASKAASEMLQQLDDLLPTPDDDEDAVKSLWDTVMELHGRGSVQYQETEDKTIDWKMRNTVARLLLHHDFLTMGVVREPLSS